MRVADAEPITERASRARIVIGLFAPAAVPLCMRGSGAAVEVVRD
jgi:hypothetical protein